MSPLYEVFKKTKARKLKLVRCENVSDFAPINTGKQNRRRKNNILIVAFWNGYEVGRLRTAGSKLDYIHLNPVRAGIVNKASEYIYSSASNYILNERLVKIAKAENPIVDVLNPNSFLKFNNY
jgi:hypothetical protein